MLQIAAIVKLDFYAPFAFPLAAFRGRVSQIFAIGNYKYILKKESVQRIVIYSRDELKQYEMQQTYDDKRIRYFIFFTCQVFLLLYELLSDI